MLQLAMHVAVLGSAAYAPPNPTPRPDPLAQAAATVHCDAATRLTVLTPRIVRVERVQAGQEFDDRATLTFVHRRTMPPAFTLSNDTTWCNVSIAGGVELTLRKPPPPLPSPPPKPTHACATPHDGFDAVCRGACARAAHHNNQTEASCCAACDANVQCGTWVFNSDTNKSSGTAAGSCWLLKHGAVLDKKPAKNRVIGGEIGGAAPQNQSLLMPGVLSASSTAAGWSWEAWGVDEANLKGTLAPTPSADLAGCCTNPNATAGEYDPKAAYVVHAGLLSRGGAALVDDAKTPRLSLVDGNLDDAWLAADDGGAGREDLYLFACGTDYRGCMRDYVSVAGPMALPSLSSLGVWWSRHWGNPHNIPWGAEYFGAMTEANIMDKVVLPYEAKGLPLHVLVMDMEWHEMFQTPCYKTGKGAWGGYSWNKTLFSDPKAFTDKLHASRGPLGIKVALNTHPDEGIDSCQDNFAAMAMAIGQNPAGAMLKDLNQLCGTEAASPATTCTRKYVEAYFKFMIEPTASDYSWTDSPKVTTWTNEMYVRYPGTKKKKRSINFSRYGGLGNHRTPIGFSGDTLRKWDTLTYQTYFTPTAANVAFGWWSHDIGGFSGEPVDDVFHTEAPELYLRWLQWGAFSPILRTHCRYCEQRIWTWGDGWYELMRKPMLLRNALVPYIYSHAALRSYPLGEALLTPTYWDPAAATHDEAYAPEYGRQYLFGRELLVAPVTAPVDNTTNTSERRAWLPPGEWVAWEGGGTLQGPAVRSAAYDLGAIPIYMRVGAVIPTRTMASAYTPLSDPLVWMLGASDGAKGSGEVYEDDGDSLGYRDGEAALTTLNFTSVGTKNLHAAISAASGTFAGIAPSRRHWLMLRGTTNLPTKATCGTVALKHVKAGEAPGYWLAAEHEPTSANGGGVEVLAGVGSLVVACPSSPLGSALAVQLTF